MSFHWNGVNICTILLLVVVLFYFFAFWFWCWFLFDIHSLHYNIRRKENQKKRKRFRIHLSWCRKFPITSLFHFFQTYPSFPFCLRLYVYLGVSCFFLFFLTQTLSITIWLFADLRPWTRNTFRGFFLLLQITVSCK